MSIETPVVTVVSPKSQEQATQTEQVEKTTEKTAEKTVEIEAKADQESQESFSKRFSALNRERKALTQKEIEIKKQMAQIEAEKAEIAKWKEEKNKIKDSKNPIAALQAHGYSYEDAVQYLLNDEKPTPDLMIKSVEEKVRSLEEQLENERKQKIEYEKSLAEQEAKKVNQQAIETIKTHLNSTPEFDALTALGMHEDIFNEINDHYNKTGEVLEINAVASEMMKKVEEMIKVVTNTSIYKNKYSAANQKKVDPPKTLSNSLHGQTVSKDKQHYKTDQERIKNALALLGK